jgi:hypothetical protein
MQTGVESSAEQIAMMVKSASSSVIHDGPKVNGQELFSRDESRNIPGIDENMTH